MEKIKDIAKSKQMILIFLCFLVYTIAQLGRYSYTSNVNYIISTYGVSNADAALPTSLFFFGYAGGQILNGIFCRKYNKKIFVTLGLIVSALCNLLLFVNIPFVGFKYVWFFNGLAQSFLWVILMLALGEKVENKYSSKVVIFMSCASSGGTLLGYGISSLLSTFNVSNYAFLVGFIGLFIMGVVWFTYCSKKDSAINFDYRNKEVDGTDKKEEVLPDAPKGLIFLIIIFSLISAGSYAIAGSLKSWAPAIFVQQYSLQDNISIILALVLPMVAMLNGVVCNFLYKKIKSFTTIALIFMGIGAVLLFVLINCINVSWVLSLILIILVCFSTGIVTNAFTVQVPIYLKNKKTSSGFLAGFFNGFCYLGNALVTFLLGFIVDGSSWTNAFYALLIMCGITIFLALIFLVYKIAVSKKKGYKIGD